MFKKNIKKLINEKLEVNNNFDEINKNINYDKYINNEVKVKVKKSFKFRYALAGVFALLACLISADYITCAIHNKKVDEMFAARTNMNETKLFKVENINDLGVMTNATLATNSYKNPILNNIFSGSVFGSTNTNVSSNIIFEGSWWDEGDSPEVEAPGSSTPGDTSSNNSYNTNIQTEGVLEADVSKCDGEYIYSVYRDKEYTAQDHFKYSYFLDIYNLNGDLIEQEIIPFSCHEMYVKDDNIVVLGYDDISIYSFENEELKLLNTFDEGTLLTSRLVENDLYLIVSLRFDYNDEESYENLYYDGCSSFRNIYKIIKYDLESNTYSEVNNLNAGYVNLYMSNNYIYLATNVYLRNQEVYKPITVVSIFDYDLNPIGAVRLFGTTLNQFSLGEYNNHLAVVTTNTSVKENGRLNALTIFDLNTLKQVGYLDKDIGLDRQIVKSVSFNGSTCYVCTYENTDPLYEIDFSDVSNPKIVSIYKAPGYSSYLQPFKINNEQYLFGIGYDDDRQTRKISIYKDDEETTQIGDDFLIGTYVFEGLDLKVDKVNNIALNDHKALFVYLDEESDLLYLGVNASNDSYYVFKIDVASEEVVSIYKEINFEKEFFYSRGYLVDGKLYVTLKGDLHIEDFE